MTTARAEIRDGQYLTVTVGPGLPSFNVVGQPDAMVQEIKNAVRAAIVLSGGTYPMRQVTVEFETAYSVHGQTQVVAAIVAGIAKA